MSNQLESVMKQFLASNKSSIPNLDKYLGLMESQQGKEMLNALSAQGGNAMKDTAQKAASGDAEATKRLISQLLTSKEGQNLAKQVMDIYKSK